MAVGLTSLAHELTLAGIRARHPKATGEQVGHEYCKLAYGAELAEQVRAERLRRRAAGERRD